MEIGGELSSIIKSLDFSSKKDLLQQLRKKRDSLKEYSNKDKKQIKPLIIIAIQQVTYTKEADLMNYKQALERKRYGRNRNN